MDGERLTEEVRKEVLIKYPQNSDFMTNAPKVNVEITRHMTEIAKKRDQHFLTTQECVGKPLLAVGSAFSLVTKKP